MVVSLTSLIIFAEGEAPKDQGGIWIILLPLLAIFTLYYFMDSPRRKESKRRDEMMKNMKKNDRVATIGGILGTVADISADGKEVTVKVSDNTRIRFRRTAISEVLGDEPETPPKAT